MWQKEKLSAINLFTEYYWWIHSVKKNCTYYVWNICNWPWLSHMFCFLWWEIIWTFPSQCKNILEYPQAQQAGEEHTALGSVLVGLTPYLIFFLPWSCLEYLEGPVRSNLGRPQQKHHQQAQKYYWTEIWIFKFLICGNGIW